MAPPARAAALLAVLALVAAQAGAETVNVQLEFDNRGTTVSSGDKQRQIQRAIAECVCNVPAGQVSYGGTLGQSSLFNAQSVQSYTCRGPSKSGRSLLQTCKDNVRSGFLSSSNAKRCVNRNTDTWMPGDSIDVKQATCTPISGSG